MNWITVPLQWYLALLVIGIVFTPLTKKLFGSFADFGYPFAKTIGIILVSYTAYVGGILHIAPFNTYILFAILIMFGIINYFIKSKARAKRAASWHTVSGFVFFEEILFLVSFLFLTYVRGQEPSIHGLEKFMDFGFINSILRSTYFPPLDMWYPPEPINYYYFGHLTGATLIKLSGVAPAIGYNLILATIFALGTTTVFSLCTNIIYSMHRRLRPAILFGIMGSFLANLAGNLHTIYLFTKGYENESPVPFWNVWNSLDVSGALKALSSANIVHPASLEPFLRLITGFNPSAYWYPNATRFIPFTIHEFPSYSYVVADLHGHVFDIPFVVLTLAFLFVFSRLKNTVKMKMPVAIIWSALFGFLIAVHYMTNAFDGPIYLLLVAGIFFWIVGLSKRFFFMTGTMVLSFITFSMPFNAFFKPFSSAIGVNCAHPALVKLGKIGPFLFEHGNCQISPLWMLLLLWGFFMVAFIVLMVIQFIGYGAPKTPEGERPAHTEMFISLLFLFGTFLITVPEFFYAKDIYPGHFRANTMFKLGYQAFIIMSVATSVVFYRVAVLTERPPKIIFKLILYPLFALVALYPFFSFRSYYGDFRKIPQLDGTRWMESALPQDYDLVKYINATIPGQPVILEAQGDSYTDYERISANTGVATVAGWQVHEWLWRGSADIVGDRIPDIKTIYESPDIALTRRLLQKYDVSYVVISQLEREKYPNLDEKKFEQIGRKVYTSTNGFGALYSLK